MAKKVKQKRTSMWLGEDLLAAADAAAAEVGVSRTVWVQQAVRAALGMRAIANPPKRPGRAAQRSAPPAEPENSVFA